MIGYLSIFEVELNGVLGPRDVLIFHYLSFSKGHPYAVSPLT
jgi:hypothetical protein